MVAATAAPRDPVRPPLFPSEKDNAALPRRPRTKEITSRYLTTPSSSSSSSTSSSSSSSSRRFPSPLMTPRPAALPATQKRSHSVDRARPSPTPTAEPSVAARALCTTTRSLSVSFQGESFFYQTSRSKASSPCPARKVTPDRRRPTASSATPVKPPDQLENSKPFDHHRWPAANPRHSNHLARSLDCSLEHREPIMAAVRLLNQFDDSARRVSFDGGDLSASSDTDSVSSGSNSGAPEARHTPSSRGISVPARFWQETNSRLRRLPQPGTTLAPQPKLVAVKKSLGDSPLSSPRSMSSPLHGPARSSSPSKLSSSPSSRGAASPLKTRNGVAMGLNAARQQLCNAPSILSFSAEVRRAKKGENRIEEAHLLRLFDNRELQWRWVNARAGAALSLHRLTAEGCVGVN
ncbi:putative QWRF family protein [Dioscorea sansibarensis]